jgi:hypothetical protein
VFAVGATSGTIGGAPGQMGDNLPYVDLGNDEQGSPLQVSDFVVSDAATCARTAEGRVKCWGAEFKTSTSAPQPMGDALPYMDFGTAGGQPVSATMIAGGGPLLAALTTQGIVTWDIAVPTITSLNGVDPSVTQIAISGEVAVGLDGSNSEQYWTNLPAGTAQSSSFGTDGTSPIVATKIVVNDAHWWNEVLVRRRSDRGSVHRFWNVLGFGGGDEQ